MTLLGQGRSSGPMSRGSKLSVLRLDFSNRQEPPATQSDQGFFGQPWALFSGRLEGVREI